MNNKIAFLALSCLKGVGFYSLKNIANSNMSFVEFLGADSFDQFLANSRWIAKKRFDLGLPSNWKSYRKDLWAKGKSLLDKLTESGISLLFSSEDDYPDSLRDVSSPPRWLFIKGNPKILSHYAVAIVGTRKPSRHGIFLADWIGYVLDKLNAVVVSGLAPGIDQIIHNHCVDRKVPTVAFLGTGILSDYPAGTTDLKNRMITQGGALVTEYLPYDSYSSKNFINRNRLQAGLSNVLIPVEWHKNSGTAHTINFAKKFNRTIIYLYTPGQVQNDNDQIKITKRPSHYIIPGDEKKLFDTLLSLKKTSNINLNKTLFNLPQERIID